MGCVIMSDNGSAKAGSNTPKEKDTCKIFYQCWQHCAALVSRCAPLGSVPKITAELHTCPRLLGYGQVPRQGAALLRLVEIEQDLNKQRIEEEAAYNLLRHIDVMIAIVGESRILRAAQQTRSA